MKSHLKIDGGTASVKNLYTKLSLSFTVSYFSKGSSLCSYRLAALDLATFSFSVQPLYTKKLYLLIKCMPTRHHRDEIEHSRPKDTDTSKSREPLTNIRVTAADVAL